MKIFFRLGVVLLLAGLFACGSRSAQGVLKEPGAVYKIDDNTSFTYTFDKKPSIGMVIVKISVLSKDGSKNTALEIIGNSGMHSMGTAHDSGETAFQLNKAGDYLLPVNVVMPGAWQVQIKFLKEKQPIYSGEIEFNVG
jgi:hypothetical protein